MWNSLFLVLLSHLLCGVSSLNKARYRRELSVVKPSNLEVVEVGKSGEVARERGSSERVLDPNYTWSHSKKHPLDNDPFLNKKDALCMLMRPLWNRAAAILGVESNPNVSQQCDDLVGFYFIGHSDDRDRPPFSEREFYWFGDREVIYNTIFKNADNSIRCNLHLNSPDYDTEPPRKAKHWGINEKSMTTVPRSQGESMITVPWSQVLSFSFVREPVGRFVSAYSEAAFRRNDSSPVAMSFFKKLIAFNLSVTTLPYDHFKYQLAPLLRYEKRFKRPIDLIGKLEDFERTWKQIEAFTGRAFRPYNEDCGQHAVTSDKNFPPRQQMKKLISKDSKIKQALGCAVLLPDFVCLGYQNLVSAQDCKDMGFHTSVGLSWDEMVHSIQESLCPDALRSNGQSARWSMWILLCTFASCLLCLSMLAPL